MAQGKNTAKTQQVSVAKAWNEGGEIEAVRASIAKYAEVIDGTDSGRDMKPLITGMFEMVDRLKALEAVEGAKVAETPLGRVKAKAEKIRVVS